MKNLYLVRHGDAVHPNVDPKRPLSEIGRREVQKVANLLEAAGVAVEQIRCSTKERAKQTADLIGNQLGVAPTTVGGLQPNDPVDPVVKEIESAGGNIMLVGHLPFLPTLAAKLLAGTEPVDALHLPTAGVLHLLEDESGMWSLKSVI
jgi:phosphohistidine phosphatase SixA